MSEFEYEIPIPKEQKILLLEIVNKARKQGILSIMFFVHKPNDPPYTLSFVFNPTSEITVNLSENPIPGFEALGFVKIIGDHNIFLMPKIFKWADYERKNSFLKWLSRLPNVVKDLMLATAFILALVLTILQIYEIVKPSFWK